MIWLFLFWGWTEFTVKPNPEVEPCRWTIGYYENREPVFVAQMDGLGSKMECPTNFIVITKLCPIISESNGTWTITFDF